MILSREHSLSNSYSCDAISLQTHFTHGNILHGDCFCPLGNRTVRWWGRNKNPVFFMVFCSYLMYMYARRVERKKYHLKWSYCGKTERYFMILLYLFFYPPFLFFCIQLSSSSTSALICLLYPGFLRHWLYLYCGLMTHKCYQPLPALFAYILALSRKESQISPPWWRFALHVAAEWLFCSFQSTGMKHCEPGSSIPGRIRICSWYIVSF